MTSTLPRPRPFAVGRGLLLSALALLAAALPSCVPDGPPRIHLAPTTAVPDRCALVLWADALDGEVFWSLHKAGRLPNITAWLIVRGVTVRSAVASLPTVTYANNVSFVTGLLPGHHGIMDSRWFDRNRLVFQDYTTVWTYRQADHDYAARTVFEVLDDEFTATILTPVRRGATRPIDNFATAGTAWFFGYQDTINHLTTVRFELISDLANQTGRWPRVIVAYFSAPDTVCHRYGPESPEYADILVDVDRQVGHICQSLAKAGLLERTYVTLLSDHGMEDTHRHEPMVGFLNDVLGLPTICQPFGRDASLEERQRHFGAARVVVAIGGDRHCAIHLRAGEHWWQRPAAEKIDGFAGKFGRPTAQLDPALAGGAPGNSGTGFQPVGKPRSANTGKMPPQSAAARTLPEMLAFLPGVDLAVVRLGPDGLRIHRRQVPTPSVPTTTSLIERTVKDGRKLYRYRVTGGTDPLGYASMPEAAALMDGQYHDAQAWLAATLRTPYPDAVVQLIEMNDSPRSGDIVLFARQECDFGSDNLGGHGGISRREVLVPWFWAGPGLPAKAAITGARTVDLMPTVLDLIGRGSAVPFGLDGGSLADRLRGAKAAE